MNDLLFHHKVLLGEITKDLRSLLNQKAQELDLTLETLVIMPDHVLLLIQRFPSEAPQKFPQMRSRLPSLWSRRHSIGTIDHVCEETIRQCLAM